MRGPGVDIPAVRIVMAVTRSIAARIPVLAFVAPSGTGKTTLMRRVTALLTREHGLRVGIIKQARGDFDVDVPGKDSYELRKAGAERLLLASEKRSALVLEHPDRGEPRLEDLLALFDQDRLDLILIEGFTTAPVPKIELSRKGRGACRYPEDSRVIALAADEPGDPKPPVVELNLNDPAHVSDFILTYFGLSGDLPGVPLRDGE